MGGSAAHLDRQDMEGGPTIRSSCGCASLLVGVIIIPALGGPFGRARDGPEWMFGGFRQQGPAMLCAWLRLASDNSRV